LDHSAAPMLKEYASQGCPVDGGRYWTAEELEAAVKKGPHSSALEPDAIEQIQREAREKSRKYRAILDLPYELLVAGYLLPSVNDATK